MRSVIAADVARCDGAEIHLSGIAAKFEPHVTLWGRFEPDLADGLPCLINRLTELTASLAFPPLELVGPRPLGDMIWYESDPGCIGYEDLRQAHNDLAQRLNGAGLIKADLLPEAFRGSGYRPHLTASWGGPAPSRWAETSLRVFVRALTLYTYESLPADGVVTRYQLHALDKTSGSPASARSPGQ